MLQDRADLLHGLLLIVCEVVDHAGFGRVHGRPAEVLFLGCVPNGIARVHHAVALDNHALVAHGRDVRGPTGALAQDAGHLRYLLGGHDRLALEAPTSSTSTLVHKVDAGQFVDMCNLLSSGVLPVALANDVAAPDGCVVANEHALSAMHDTDARDEAGAWRLVLVSAPSSERGELQEVCAWVDDALDPLSRQQLPLGTVRLHTVGASAAPCPRHPLLKILHQFGVVRGPFREGVVLLDPRTDDWC
mmetsp:Transcript_43582/g.100816  ORF Transcript_43582/g.100816 Transcript_43582/m.100816 type:complete len:246 (+) Transcript_43582:901-1638(+)